MNSRLSGHNIRKIRYDKYWPYLQKCPLLLALWYQILIHLAKYQHKDCYDLLKFNCASLLFTKIFNLLQSTDWMVIVLNAICFYLSILLMAGMVFCWFYLELLRCLCFMKYYSSTWHNVYVSFITGSIFFIAYMVLVLNAPVVQVYSLNGSEYDMESQLNIFSSV